jgi:hypothetical protein
MRLNYDGVEQLVDESWTWDVTVREGERIRIPVTFIDARSGAIVTQLTASFQCRDRIRRKDGQWHGNADLTGY